MSVVSISTANIYWFGLSRQAAKAAKLTVPFFHEPSDDERLASMLKLLSADLFCFQEIVDAARFEKVLKQANPALHLRDAAGQLVSSLPAATQPDANQRVLLAPDQQDDSASRMARKGCADVFVAAWPSCFRISRKLNLRLNRYWI